MRPNRVCCVEAYRLKAGQIGRIKRSSDASGRGHETLHQERNAERVESLAHEELRAYKLSVEVSGGKNGRD